MELIKCRPILINNLSSSPSKVGLWKHSKTGVISLWKDYFSMDHNWYGYDLILYSLNPNDEIKIGDKYFDEHSKFIGTATVNFGRVGDDSSKKIVATHSELPINYIKNFIDDYNKDKIFNVDVVFNNGKPIIENGKILIKNNDLTTPIKDKLKKLAEEVWIAALKSNNNYFYDFQTWFDENQHKFI